MHIGQQNFCISYYTVCIKAQIVFQFVVEKNLKLFRIYIEFRFEDYVGQQNVLIFKPFLDAFCSIFRIVILLDDMHRSMHFQELQHNPCLLSFFIYDIVVLHHSTKNYPQSRFATPKSCEICDQMIIFINFTQHQESLHKNGT